MINNPTQTYDVVVVGGGAAAGVHGLLSRDGIDPLELLDLGRAEVRDQAVGILATGPRAVHMAAGSASAGAA